MSVVLAGESRKVETPNGVMTTLASPTQGRAGQAVWRVDGRAAGTGRMPRELRNSYAALLAGLTPAR